MNSIFLLLGGNLGDRAENLSNAIAAIEMSIGKLISKSSIYQTKAWGLNNQPDYYNQAIKVETILLPEELLANTQNIEQNLGRKRLEKWGARTMDIDILFYNSDVINLENLKIPHPLIYLRKFVLVPLSEIAPDFVHPILNKPINLLNSECEDDLMVTQLKNIYTN